MRSISTLNVSTNKGYKTRYWHCVYFILSGFWIDLSISIKCRVAECFVQTIIFIVFQKGKGIGGGLPRLTVSWSFIK